MFTSTFPPNVWELPTVVLIDHGMILISTHNYAQTATTPTPPVVAPRPEAAHHRQPSDEGQTVRLSRVKTCEYGGTQV